MTKVLRIILTLFAAVFALNMAAQTAPYKYDFGASVGISGYLGEGNGTNPLAHPGLNAELAWRYVANTRLALRTAFEVNTLSGNTDRVANALPQGQEAIAFTSQVYGLNVRGEFNFFSYGIGETYKRLRRWSPYVFAGVGFALAKSGDNLSATPTIPLGLGLKFKLSERLNLMAEFGMTKTFTDKIDSASMTDLNQIETAFYKNTDWLSHLSIGLSFEFGKRCETCHYVD